MTIEQLCKLTRADWDKISTYELHKFLEPYLKITRPETGKIADIKPKPKNTIPSIGTYKKQMKNEALAMLEQLKQMTKPKPK